MATVYKQRIFQFGLCILFCMTFTLDTARSWNKNSERNYDRLKERGHKDRDRLGNRAYTRGRDAYSYGQRREKSVQPNIIFIVTDDQDELLGSMSTMTKTLKYLGSEGVRFNNSFVSTPMCCPSRSSILTGLYPHNHHVYTNNDNCSGIEWQKVHEPRTFAKYLSDAGYRTGFFGKYLNKYNGTYVPPGWREWVGLVRNSRFYNYTLNFNGQKVKHDDNYFQDYFTDLIANDSVTFLKQSKKHFHDKPVMMMLSVPAPHGPEDSAPQYQHMFHNNQLHRTASWNYMNNSDKQTLLKEMRPLEPIEIKFTDVLQQKRLQTLQSVDSLVEKVYTELKFLGELENTYIIYTSDHGYHLGQFGVVKGKALPYDFDIRVPLYIRGPGISRNTIISNPVVNIDLAPTILDMAGIEIPEHMDGRSLLKLVRNSRYYNSVEHQGFVESKRPWRHTVLLERGRVSVKKWKTLEREKDKVFLEDYQEEMMPFANPKLRKMLKVCKDPENHPPCKHQQKWVCFRDDRNRQRIKKCRNYNRTVALDNMEALADQPVQVLTNEEASHLLTNQNEKKCLCRKNRKLSLDVTEEMVQRDFLKTYVNKKDFEPKFIRKRSKRRILDNEEDLQNAIFAYQTEGSRRRCRFYPNDTYSCEEESTEYSEKWSEHKRKLDELIAETRRRLKDLKKLKKDMKKQHRHKRKHKHDKQNQQTEIYPGQDTNKDRDMVEPEYPGHGTNVYDDVGPEVEEEWCDCDNETMDGGYYDNDFESLNNEYDIDDSTEEDDYLPDFLGETKKRKCNHSNMKCVTHTNEHWKTPPYWNGRNNASNQPDEKLTDEKLTDEKLTKIVNKGVSFNHPLCKVNNHECHLMRNDHWKVAPFWKLKHLSFVENDDDSIETLPPLTQYRLRDHPYCKIQGMECKLMDNTHWKTVPKWTYGPFCFCTNSNSNIYWCLRTVNESHNFLYCEFIDDFMSFYDFNKDPYQLHNTIKDVNLGVLQQLHEDLVELRRCQGPKECSKRSQFIKEEKKDRNHQREKERRRRRRRKVRNQRKHAQDRTHRHNVKEES